MSLASSTSPARSHPRLRLPARYATLAWVAAVYLALNLVVRLGLVVFEGDAAQWHPLRLLHILGVGLVYDLAALSWVLVPFALLALPWPDRAWGRRVHAVLACLLLGAGLVGMLFTAASEGLFWNEFASRFNFIAVDYLIYTREVVGNIRESYPVGAILGAIGGLAALLFGALARPFWRAASAAGGGFGARLLASGAVLLLPLLAFFAVGDAPRESLASASARELAGNGYYEFMRAFRSNDLDFNTFYRTLPEERAHELLREELGIEPGLVPTALATPTPARTVRAAGPVRPLNLVLVSMESLGADYVGAFGGRPGLTPNLDALAGQGLVFTRLYATGLRTVRGLEALTLSMPPTPGHAVPMRHNNKGFQTLGGVLKSQGWQSLYLYGGYSQFDNMRDFFGGNGYTVIDRTDIPAGRISHETIWGVADEDLFHQAVRELDARTANGQHVFAHVMTTSNHRPYTYPAGRIDIPSGSGRDGAVKYADWAIGRFIEEAKARPWFRDTMFVFVADHTSHGRGHTDLPPENYRIPAIVYSPAHVAPARVDTLASQIDIAPTLLALLNVSYTSRFFGHDILSEGEAHPRALMANYLTVGYMEDGLIAELMPKQRVRVLEAASGRELPADDMRAQRIAQEAIAHYQVATEVLRTEGRAEAVAGIVSLAAPPKKTAL